MNLILIGARCTGKTSAGRRLAERLGLPFFDTDEAIVRESGNSVEKIVAGEGWPAFRERERVIVQELSGMDRSVIALGGGAVLDPGNVEALKRNGLFVRLVADAETIRRRMEKDESDGTGRPSLSGQPAASEVQQILAEREPLYRRIADLAVDTSNRTAEEVAAEILEAMEKMRLCWGRSGTGTALAGEKIAKKVDDASARIRNHATDPVAAVFTTALGAKSGTLPADDRQEEHLKARAGNRRREK